MRYVDEFRDPAAAAALAARITELAAGLEGTLSIMEVCGSHTMAIARYGIRSLLPPNLRLISGPGCPVCVTDAGYLDAAVALARRGVVVATFGDLIHVPGSETTLARCRAEGATVEVCYSPLNALDLARRDPGREVVFLAVGFETTIAPTVSLVARARQEGVRNLSLLTAFKLVPPALRALLADPEVRIDAFLCPAHVSAVIGPGAYAEFSGAGGVPCVIAGFEPLDVLDGIAAILAQRRQGAAGVENRYARVVKEDGNPLARKMMNDHLQAEDADWRGIGRIPGSGLRLRPALAGFDAAERHGVAVTPGHPDPRCRCGQVLKGVLAPEDCPMFARACHPGHPVGPCMVSSEGACAAQYRYGRHEADRASDAAPDGC
jgi:hydrogenase expression/formation protein HypD